LILFCWYDNFTNAFVFFVFVLRKVSITLTSVFISLDLFLSCQFHFTNFEIFNTLTFFWTRSFRIWRLFQRNPQWQTEIVSGTTTTIWSSTWCAK
jgi:hypothetical protein